MSAISGRAAPGDARLSDLEVDAGGEVLVEAGIFDHHLRIDVVGIKTIGVVSACDRIGNKELGGVLYPAEPDCENHGIDGGQQFRQRLHCTRRLTMTLNSAEANDNGAAGLHVEAGGRALINDCVFISAVGVGPQGVSNQGTLLTRENNTVFGHTGALPLAVGAY